MELIRGLRVTPPIEIRKFYQFLRIRFEIFSAEFDLI